MSINMLGTFFHERPQLCAGCRPLSANVWKDPCHQMSSAAYVDQTCPKQSQKSKIITAGVPKGEVECADKSNCYFRQCIIIFFWHGNTIFLVYTCQILIQLFKRHWLRYFSGFLDEISCLAKFFISTAMKNRLVQFNLIGPKYIVCALKWTIWRVSWCP